MRKQLTLTIIALITALSLACSPQSQETQETPEAKATTVETAKPQTAQATDTAKAVAQVPAKRVFFANLKEGAQVKSPLKVEFGVKGMTIRPAGEDVNDKTSGHHHLIIDGEGIKAGDAVPMNATHIHYGKGQTEAEITLKPGDHTLRLQFADGAHRSYGPEMSTAITVKVAVPVTK